MRQRVILVLGVAAPAAVVSYTAQRLIDALSEPTGVILLTAHIPYFWRVALAALHGGTAGLLVGLLTRAPEAWIARLPGLTAASTLLCAVAMALRP